MSRRYLLVTVHEGKNLIACEKNGTSSPYVAASLLNMTSREVKNEKDKTEYKSRTLNPKWDHRMTFGGSYDLNNVDVLPTLCLKVFHKGSTFSADQPMGIVEIPLDTINPTGSPMKQFYPLQKTGRMKDVAGELLLTIKFSGPPNDGTAGELEAGGEDIGVDMPNEEEDPDHVDEPPNEVIVTVIRGRNLIIMDPNLIGSGGSSDPLVKIKIDGHKSQRTKTIKKNLNPVWNETLKFEYVDDESLSLDIVVEDEDLVKNDFMGKVIVPLGSFENKKAVRKWYKLKDANGNADTKPRGEIELVIWWHFNIELKLNPKKEGIFSGVKKGFGALGKVLGSDDEEEESDGEVFPVACACVYCMMWHARRGAQSLSVPA